MERSIYRFVINHSWRETAMIAAIAIASQPFYYLSLDVPKDIINKAIQGRGITYPHTFWGVEFSQVGFLMLLCSWFLVLVLINGGLKQYINTLKGRLGERLLRRLRYELTARILRFPIPHFRKASAGELIPMVTAEVETLGGFMGDVFVQPLIQAGTLLTLVAFLFVQNPIMGLAAISLYPIQGWIIPKLQRRVNQLGKERVRAVRKLSERIGEAVGGVQEIHAHGTTLYERADFSDRLGVIYRIRFEIFQRKSFVKFLNNFLNQMTPLMFYSIGGYLAIEGQLTVGALAAALTANKDMSAPWKELLDYYQQTQGAKITYEQVTEQFRPENMFDEKLMAPITEPPPRLEGPIAAANLALVEDGNAKVLDNVSFTVNPGEKIAVVGPTGGGKEALAMLLVRLQLPSAGRLAIAGQDITGIPEPILGARVGYAGQSIYLFAASVRDNLLYGLRQRPVTPRARDETAERTRRAWLAESARAGNLALDSEADWTDYAAAGVKDASEFTHRALEVLAAVDMADDIYNLGLRGTINPERKPEIAAAILKARAAFQARISDPALAALVEPFDVHRYNSNATLAENLMFGTPVDPSFEVDRMATNPYVLSVLDKVGLTRDLVATGRKVAETMVELFAGLPPDHEFFQQFSFISSDDLPEFQSLLARVPADAVDMKGEDRARLLSLPFKLIEARHRLGLMDEVLKSRVLEARKVFHEGLTGPLEGKVAFFEADSYSAAATIQDNILFGKLAYGQAHAAQRVGKLVADVLDELDLREAVLEVGLDYPAGLAGARLAPAQRQKLGIARALLKRPDVLVVNETTAILDPPSQTRVLEGVLRESEGRTVVWVLHNAGQARHFDRVFVFMDGRLHEHGRFEELERPGTAFADLLAAA